jgi:hypothetical protein
MLLAEDHGMISRPTRFRPWLLVLACAGGCSSTSLSADAGGDAAPVTACALDAVYTYGYDGGNAAFHDKTTLTPPGSYRRTRAFPNTPEPPSDLSCAPALPACNGSSIDVADIVRDLADADVRTAFGMASPPTYGNDPRPVDGAIFQILRADGHGFLAGADCEAGSFCHGPVPPGVARLVSDLQALDQQQLADPTCGPLSPPH